MGPPALPVPRRGPRRGRSRDAARRRRGSSSRRCGWPASSTTSATGRSPTSSTTTSSRPSRHPPDRRRPAGQAADPRGPLPAHHRARARRRSSAACGGRPATGSPPATPSPPARRSTRRGSPSSSRSRRSTIPAMPRWVRWLQPLFSGVFTVDNLDYVRRDAYLTGVSAGPVDAERLRRYAFVSERGLTLYEPGLAALEMFLTARLFMYQQVYFHRTVRGIDLDLAEVFGPSIAAIFGEASPADDLRRYADLDEYALLHQAARWARGEDVTLDAGTRQRPGRPARRRDLAPDPAPPPALARRGGDPRRVRVRAAARGRRRHARDRRAGAGDDRPGGRRRATGGRRRGRAPRRRRSRRAPDAAARGGARPPSRLRPHRPALRADR